MDTMELLQYYPSEEELNSWIDEIWETALHTPYTFEISQDATAGMKPYMFVGHSLWKSRFVKFMPEGMDEFYCYWQPVQNGPAPLCAHVPGYGSEICMHPDTVAQGFNVLHISPMGFGTPEGINTEKRDNPGVLPESVLSLGKKGYKTWLTHCVIAVLWAWKQEEVIPDRVSFFGTSQGGGCSLLLGSLFKDKGVRCVASDEPYLTNYPAAQWRCAYEMPKAAFEKTAEEHGIDQAAKALGYVDTICHAHRLTVPVLLTSGGADELCPPDTIEGLFKILPGTKSYTHITGRSHGFTPEFIQLAWAWFRLFA